MSDVVINYVGDSSDLVAAAKQAQKANRDVSKSVGALAKEFKDADDAIKAEAKQLGVNTSQLQRAKKAAEDASKGTEKLKEQSGEAASSIGKMKSAVGLLSPELEGALDSVQRLADGTEGLSQAGGGAALALGATGLLAAVGLLVAIYESLNKQLDEANERMEEAALRAEQATNVNREHEKAMLALRAATDEEAAAELSRIQAMEKAEAIFSVTEESLDEQIKKNRELRDEVDSLTHQFMQAIRVFPVWNLLIAESTASTESLDDQLEGLREQQKNLNRTIDQTAIALEGEQAVRKEVVKKVKTESSARKDNLAALREVERALKQLSGIEQKMVNEQLTGLDAIDAKYDALTTQVEDLANTYTENIEIQAQADDALHAIRLGHHNERMSWMEEEREKETQAAEASADDTKQRLEAAFDDVIVQAEAEQQVKLDLAGMTTDALLNMSDMLLERRINNLDLETKAGRRLARRAAKIQKGLAVTGAIANSALALVKSVATNGPPVPPNIAGIAGFASAAAIGATSIAGAAMTPMPEFPIGGIVPQMSVDHQAVGVQSGEAILNRQATEALGPEGVDALNNLGATPQPIVVAVPVYEHEVLEPAMDDFLAAGGGTLRKRIDDAARPSVATRIRR
jgi:DNA repair exonuclease SbcCD ATPase subunit